MNPDLSCIPEYNSKTGRTGYSNHAMICAFIVMKCEGFSQISDLLDFLSNNLIIAYHCGFNIKANSFLPLAECSFLADKAYDVKAIYNTVRDTYNGDCFIALNKRNTKNPKKLPSGNIICEAGLAMHKDGKLSDNGRTRQKYSCPFKRSKSGSCPCNHKCWNNGKKNRGCTKNVTLPDDYRLLIDRSSIAFKAVYALRTEIERYNSRFKQAGCERVFVRNGNSVKNLNTLANISLLAVAIAAVVTKKDASYRSVKTLKRLA